MAEMESFYDELELKKIGLKKVGNDVKISRYANFYAPENISIGDHVRIDDFCILSGEILIGNYIHIAAYSALYGSDVGIEIGDFANISSGVRIYAVNDDYSGESLTNPMIPECYKKLYKGKVVLQKHVIIGSGSVVLPGVELREGSAFGSMCLIKHSSQEWTINAGIPAKEIKRRSKKLLEKEKQMLALNNQEKQ